VYIEINISFTKACSLLLKIDCTPLIIIYIYYIKKYGYPVDLLYIITTLYIIATLSMQSGHFFLSKPKNGMFTVCNLKDTHKLYSFLILLLLSALQTLLLKVILPKSAKLMHTIFPFYSLLILSSFLFYVNIVPYFRNFLYCFFK